MKDVEIPSRHRPGFFLFWGIAWLIFYLAVIGLGVLLVSTYFTQGVPAAQSADLSGVFWTWLLLGPMAAYMFFVAPWFLLSQSGLGFTLMAQSLDKKYSKRKLQRFVGGAHATMNALIDTPATRFWTTVGLVGFWPGMLFVGSLFVLAIGAFVMLYVAPPLGAVAGVTLLVGGAIAAVLGIRSRFRKDIQREWPFA